MTKAKHYSNYQDLLKVLALISMLIDHFGLYMFPQYDFLRIIGRFAMPIFTFYAGYNFKNSIRHLVWIWGVILVIFSKFIFVDFFTNILVSIGLGQFYLLYFGDRIGNNLFAFFSFILLIFGMLLTDNLLDYGTLSIAFMQIGFMAKKRMDIMPYLLFACISLAILNLSIFRYNEILDFAIMFGLVILSCYALFVSDHKKEISVNINIISRNMLYIYTLSSMVFMIFAAGLRISIV